MCRGVFGSDEEGGGSNGAPYSYLFVVSCSRGVDNEAACNPHAASYFFLSYAPRGLPSRGVDSEAA